MPAVYGFMATLLTVLVIARVSSRFAVGVNNAVRYIAQLTLDAILDIRILVLLAECMFDHAISMR